MSGKRDPVCVSVINMKGGVGKTTIAALLGQHAADRDWRVLVVDLDPQANLSQAYMGDNYVNFLDSKAPSIVEIFDGYVPPTRHRASPAQLDPRAAVQEFYPDALFRTYLLDRISLTISFERKPDSQVLARCISNHFQEKDLVLIDCPPTESVFTRAAYHASRYVLVPVRPEYFATIGFPLLSKSLDEFKTENPTHYIDIFGIVINNGFYDGGNDGGPEKRRALPEIYEEVNKNDWHVFENQIPFSLGFPKLMRGDRRHSGKAKDFKFFADEFLIRLDMKKEIDAKT